jgi:hypothetical protein
MNVFDEFEKWLKERDNKATFTAYNYGKWIVRIFKHYSKKTDKDILLAPKKMTIENIAFVSKLLIDFGDDGRFANFGRKAHGAVPASIKAYIRFLRDKKSSHLNAPLIKKEPIKNALIAQVGDLFPGYKFRGEFDNAGFLLLENDSAKSLLVIKLLSRGETNGVIWQIDKYLNELERKYYGKMEVTGIIIAKKIDESLKEACQQFAKNIKTMEYKVKLTLEEVKYSARVCTILIKNKAK